MARLISALVHLHDPLLVSYFQDLLKERAEAARQSDETAQKLVAALTDKDNDIKVCND